MVHPARNVGPQWFERVEGTGPSAHVIRAKRDHQEPPRTSR